MSEDTIYSGKNKRVIDDIIIEYTNDPVGEHGPAEIESGGLLRNLQTQLEDETNKRRQTEELYRRLELQYLQLAEKIENHKKGVIGPLAGGIAHDVNNLLMGIQGNVSLMLTKYKPGEEEYSRLKNIEQYISNGSQLIMQLLGIARTGNFDPFSGNEITMHTETVLLVDDEQMIRDVATEMLQSLGCTVIQARNGAEAIELYREKQHKIDLVILDMIMPMLNGEETFDRLMKMNPGIKVLLSSGYTPDDQAGRIMARGCKGFIQKPYTIAGLSRKIKEVTENRKKG